MNISTGGPHILLFERDQQLTALCMSEFQLAGYECHAARTAVEVFDAIARFPVRLVLVNLAQAAASRREFWVALDTQRRGRGVQVLTFTCANLASYGPQDADERSQPQLADMQIDGMLGLMSLVDAVRTRVPGSGATTNTLPRLSRSANASAPIASLPPMTPSVTTQAAGAIQQPPANTVPSYPNGTAYRVGMTPDMPNSQPVARAGQPPAPVATPQPAAGNVDTPQQSYTDKIRAVLYPNQRSWSGASTQETGRPTAASDNTQDSSNTLNTPPLFRTPPASDSSMLQQLANGQVETEGANESGLAQLSRMVQASRSPRMPVENRPVTQPVNSVDTAPSTMFSTGSASIPAYTPAVPRPMQEQEHELISTQALRASPIEDLPAEKGTGNPTGGESQARAGQPTVVATPLASITMPMPAVTRPIPVPDTTSGTAISASPPSPPMVEHQATENNNSSLPAQNPPVLRQPAQEQAVRSAIDVDDEPTRPGGVEEDEEEENFHASVAIKEAQRQRDRQPERPVQAEQKEEKLPNNAMLLDIVQSLPPMPSPPPVQQALQGRATRSLGTVLLEGHLVPESRLEVAQNIQRMLRGVDLNYQLGEILLMFKLLTPDQLLAASLVSYGLITTQQIVALGRIRQELHAIGLEYDLENLLILFRILSPDQLREVRSSWQS